MNKFSIILPVRNGGDYVKECVYSILNQSLNDFNLLVLDNCSTDGTREWIKSLGDGRIQIFESDRSLSIEENWSRIVSIPKNEFITLIGHDDRLHENYLQVMNDLIIKYPDASLYQSHFSLIGSDGKVIRACKQMKEKENAADFLASVLQNNFDLYGTGFMMRSNDYDEAGGIPSYPSLLFADFELWMKLTRLSYKVTSPEVCFDYRIHQSTTKSSPDIIMQKAFQRFIVYLQTLKQDEKLKSVIEQDSLHFIAVYCKGLSHRMIRKTLKEREGLGVSQFVQSCKEYADLLVPGNNFNPLSIKSVWLAQLIDSNMISRKLFRLFKRYYTKPVLK